MKTPEEIRQYNIMRSRRKRLDPVFREKQRVKALEYYYAHREKQMENGRNYRKNNPQKMLEWQRKWAKAHPDKIKARNQRSYLKRRKVNVEYARQYRLDHPNAGKEYHSKHKEENRLHTIAYRQRHPDLIKIRRMAHFYVPLMPCCEVCDSEDRLSRHHEDYDDPLNVITVCKKCHEGFEFGRH